MASLPRRPSNVVGQTACAADTDGHGSDLGRLLLVDQGADVRLAWEHLHTRRRRVDLLGAPGPRDEQQDLEDVATLVHAEDLRHPGPDPFKVLGRLDDPDQDDLPGGAGAVRIGVDEVADMGDLVCDAHTGGEEHDRAVRLEALLAVRTLNESSGDELAARRPFSFLEHLVCEACSAANNKRHALCLFRCEQVLRGAGQRLLVREGRLVVTPGQGEGMRGPEPNRWHVHVHVLAGLESPWLGDAEGDSDSVTREGLDFSFGQAVAGVAADDGVETCAALKGPEDDGSKNECLLRQALKVNPDTSCRNNNKRDVGVEECLVKCMAEDGGRVAEQCNERACADHTTEKKFAVTQGRVDHGPALSAAHGHDFPSHPECRVSEGL